MANMTNLTNIGSAYDMADYAAKATGGVFWAVIIVVIFIVLIFKLNKHGIERAVASASFSCLFLSLFLFYLGWLQVLFPVFLAIILAGSLFYIRFSPNA